MQGRWRHNTNQRNIITLDNLAPIVCDVRNLELFGYALRVFTIAAGNRCYACAHAISKSRDLRRTRKSSADNADADSIIFLQDEIW
jgi:hypothetical protein